MVSELLAFLLDDGLVVCRHRYHQDVLISLLQIDRTSFESKVTANLWIECWSGEDSSGDATNHDDADWTSEKHTKHLHRGEAWTASGDKWTTKKGILQLSHGQQQRPDAADPAGDLWRRPGGLLRRQSTVQSRPATRPPSSTSRNRPLRGPARTLRIEQIRRRARPSRSQGQLLSPPLQSSLPTKGKSG